MGTYRVVAIGASAGGVEAVSRFVKALPPDFPAAVLVTVHVSPAAPSVLPAILTRAGNHPAASVVDGAAVEPGRIYVAPPDHHLVVEGGRLRRSHAAKENGVRPAIDPMLCSAALEYGNEMVGVVLTGGLNDGTAGLLAVSNAGGYTAVQDPDEAMYRSMPESARRHVDVDAVLPLDALAAHVAALVTNEERSLPDDVERAAVDADDVIAPASHPSIFSCPDCGGVLWEVEKGFPWFRCRVGHAFTAETLMADQSQAIEQALWTAARALEERAALSRRMADAASDRRHPHTARRFREGAEENDRSAALVRHLLERPVAPAAVEEPVDGESAV